MITNKYSRTARLYPAIISLIPILLLTISLSNNELESLLEQLVSVKIIGNVSMGIVLIYLLAQTNRFIGKEFFERRYFKTQLQMPTTEILLYSTDYISTQFKEKIRKKIERDFSLNLPSKVEEEKNNDDARRRIVDAVALVRGVVGDGKLLLQHNIEYGFVRNLIGSIPIGLSFSIVDIIYFQSHGMSNALKLAVALTLFWFLLLLASKYLMRRYGILYARRLFEEYISQQRKQ